jgi:hypothetical protein
MNARMLTAILGSLVAVGCGRGAGTDKPDIKDSKAISGTTAPVEELVETPELAGEDAGTGSAEAVRQEGSARPPRWIKKKNPGEIIDFPKPGPDQMVAIPGGTLLAGSTPEDVLRVQYAESDLVPFEMSPFEMDALPFPNDPDRPFYTNVTRAEAEQTCAEVGKRLCTELEWEWACKTAKHHLYPTGDEYRADAYPDDALFRPASGAGVFGMGRILEWTSSAWGNEPDQVERGVARGFADGQESEPAQGRRCAHRWRRTPDSTNPSLGFRCCRGEENKASLVIEGTRPPFSLYSNMKPEKFAEVIRSIPELKAVHDNPHMFSDADVRAVLARRESDREELSKSGIHFRWKPIRWIPRQGMELWVAVGRSNRHAFVVALHEVEDNEKYAHASSLILWNQPLPLALAYREGHRDELYWAPCWGCRDGGAIAFDDATNQVIITHKW